MSSFYCQGLEFFGSATRGDLGNVVDAQTAVAAWKQSLGYAMTSEKVEWNDGSDKDDNVLGTEIDLGLNWMVKENVSWGFSAVYVMPGEAMVNSQTSYNLSTAFSNQGTAGTDDAMTLLSTNLTYSF